jgi:YVTN family beta-propeller protein
MQNHIDCHNSVHLILLLAGFQACNSDSTRDDAARAGSGALPIAVEKGGAPAPAPAPNKPDNANARKAYVGLFGDDALGIIDLDQQATVKTVPVTAPDGIAITPDGKKVFVSSADTGRVKVLDTKSETFSASIDVGAKPAGLVISPDGKILVAAVGGDDSAVIIDTETNEIMRKVTVKQAHAACITTDSRFAYVGSQDTAAPAVVEVPLDKDGSPRSLSVDKSPRMLACEAEGIYFTGVGLDAVELLHPDTGELATPIESGGSPHDIRASEPGKTELVVSQTAGDLEFIDVASEKITDKVPTGKLAHWIALNGDRDTAYVTNEGDDSLSVVDLGTRSVTATFDVGHAPRKLVLKP